MTALRSLIRQLAREFENEDAAAFDLWTWLPSYASAKFHHGDYADEHRPSLTEIMHEVTNVIARLKHGQVTCADLVYYECPCGEHDESERQQLGRVRVVFIHNYGVAISADDPKPGDPKPDAHGADAHVKIDNP